MTSVFVYEDYDGDDDDDDDGKSKKRVIYNFEMFEKSIETRDDDLGMGSW